MSPLRVGYRGVYIQYLRAVAALSVLLFHLSYTLATERHVTAGAVLWFGWSFGRLGVVLFFVISGALMALIADRAGVARFLAHRVIRIYPTYWLVASAVNFLPLVDGVRVSPDVRAFALVPGGPWRYLLGTEWTLPFELSFYLIIAVAMRVGAARHLHWIGALWLVAVIGAQAADPALAADWQFPILPVLPLTEFSAGFAAGLTVPWLLRKTRHLPDGWFNGIASAAALLCLVSSEISAASALWAVVIACTCLVTAAMRAPRRGEPATRPVLAKLGDWSYGLYLCHVPVITWVLRHASGDADPKALWLAAVCLSLLWAAMIGQLDVALHRRLKRWVDDGPPRLRSALAAVFVVVQLGGSATLFAAG